MSIPSTPPDGKFRILIVEDDLMIGRLVAMNLSKVGLEANHAPDGASGWQAFQETDPHLVITDIMMPGLNGHELCARIRQTSEIPIIMMTAADSEERQMQGFKVGADDYVPKPFNPKLLVARVVANLRRVYRYNPAVAQTGIEDIGTANDSDESKLPQGWLSCDSCGYMGPQERFEANNARGQRVMVCPACRETNITFSIG